MWPQITYLILIILGVGIHLGKHGEKQDIKYNFFKRVLTASITLYLLHCGGFFSNIF